MPKLPFLPELENRPVSARARRLTEDAKDLIDGFYEKCERRCTPLALEFLAQSTEELLIRHMELVGETPEPEMTDRLWISFWLAALTAHLRKLSEALREQEGQA